MRGRALGLATFFIATSTYADDPKTDAARLFEDGRKLVAEGRFAEACPKLAESMRLVPNGGTLLNLAECYEKNGQTASAYLRYREAATRAKAAGQAKAETIANNHARSLEGTVAKLTVRLAPQSAEGTTITIDGGPATVGEAAPIDPGDHTVVAAAASREPFSRTVHVPRTAALIEIEMPVLRGGSDPVPTPSPPVTEPPVAPAPASNGFTTMQWVGLGTAGVGVVSVIVGSAFGLSAKAKNDDAAKGCINDDPNRCTPASVQQTESAKSAATLSTVFFIVGGAALAGGAALFVLGRAPKAPAARAALTVLSGAPLRF